MSENFRVRVEKHKNKWRVRHKNSEGKWVTDYGQLDTKNDAIEYRDQVKEKLMRLALGEFDESLLLDTLFRRFVKSRETNRYAQKTIKKYEETFKAFFAQTPVKLLGELTRDAITNWKAKMTAVGNANNTVRNRLSDLRTFLNWLVEEEKILKVSPFGLKMIPKKTPLRIKFWSYEEWHVFKAEIAKRNHYAHLACLLAYTAGLRKTETVNVTYNDLQYDGDEVHLVIEGEISKNKDPRALPLDPEAMQLIGSRRIGKLAHLTVGQLDNFFERARKISGINPKLTIHGLRHSFAKNYLQSGQGNLASLKALLGHKDIISTMVYAQFEKNYFRQGIQKVYEERQRLKALMENAEGKPVDPKILGDDWGTPGDAKSQNGENIRNNDKQSGDNLNTGMA